MNLTDEQIKIISTCWSKWQGFASNIEPVDRIQSTQAINFLYKQANLDEPEIIFVDNPYQYYAQAFLGSMPDDIRSMLEPILKSNPNNLFFDEFGDNIAQILAQQFLLPIECLNGEYLRKTLTKVRQGKTLQEARQEADEEVYSPEDKITLRSIAKIDLQFLNQFGAGKIDYTLHIQNNRSWMGTIYDSLYSSLNIPRALIAEIIDRGYHDFSGIQVGCFDRVLLAFACARFDYLRDILNLDPGTNEENIKSLVESGGRMFFSYRKTCLICESLDLL
jgi:hypothetical protein